MGHQSLHIVPAADEKGGSFRDSDRLLPLFADPDARRPRRWGDIFDANACEEVEAADLVRSMPSLF